MEQALALPQYLADGAAAFSLEINKQQSDAFLQYLRTLSEWNRLTNLTAIEDPHEIIIKHFVDSIAPLHFGLIQEEAAILDVGTGAGFPGIPLKIMRADLRLTLLEPNQKKISFLLYLIGLLRLQDVLTRKLSLAELAGDNCQTFDVAVIRGLKPGIADLQSLSPFLKPDGMVLVYRTAPMDKSQILDGFVVSNEWTYELPFGYGRRVLTRLIPTRRFNVPRGTVA